MTRGQLLLRCEREWPWGLVFIEDGASQEVPDVEDVGRPAGTESVVYAPVMHAVDGSVLVEVLLGPVAVDPAWSCVWDAPLMLASGVVRVGDAEFGQTAQVRPGRWQLSLYVDREQHAEHLRCVLDQLS